LNIPSFVLLLALAPASYAAPLIDPELEAITPRDELRSLVDLAQATFGKHVEAIEYSFRDNPPGGNPVAVVKFSAERGSDRVYTFPSALYYFLEWPDNADLPPEKRRRIDGSWASDGELRLSRMYRFELRQGIKYLAFDDSVTYEEAFQLISAVEDAAFDIDPRSGHRQIDEWVVSLDRRDIEREISEHAWRVVREGEHVPAYLDGEERLTLHAEGPLVGMAMYTFSIMAGKYTLISVLPYAF
jgi:hypothetical protein